MNLKTAQAEARFTYSRGGFGAIVSGIIWLIVAIIASKQGINTAFIVLFFGGMFIFPLSVLLLKLFYKRSMLPKGHPSGQIVGETVFPMIGFLFVAWLFIPYKPEWVLSIAAIGVGTHYFGFRSAYGDFSYWVLGGIVTAVGFVSIVFKQPSHELVPYIVAAIEIIFGIWFIVKSPNKSN